MNVAELTEVISVTVNTRQIPTEVTFKFILERRWFVTTYAHRARIAEPPSFLYDFDNWWKWQIEGRPTTRYLQPGDLVKLTDDCVRYFERLHRGETQLTTEITMCVDTKIDHTCGEPVKTTIELEEIPCPL